MNFLRQNQGMAQSSPPTLAYAWPDTRPRRWSKSAIVSILIPVFVFPANKVLFEILDRGTSWEVAVTIANTLRAIAYLAGLAIAIATLARIRRSAGRLRGRLLALIGLGFSAVGITMMIGALYSRSPW
jgi:hypothetical protein